MSRARPNMTEVGQITLASFPNAAGLNALGGNLFQATEASGAAVTGLRGRVPSAPSRRLSRVSNVDPVKEITDLISAQRAYEMNSKVIQGRRRHGGRRQQGHPVRLMHRHPPDRSVVLCAGLVLAAFCGVLRGSGRDPRTSGSVRHDLSRNVIGPNPRLRSGGSGCDAELHRRTCTWPRRIIGKQAAAGWWLAGQCRCRRWPSRRWSGAAGRIRQLQRGWFHHHGVLRGHRGRYCKCRHRCTKQRDRRHPSRHGQTGWHPAVMPL